MELITNKILERRIAKINYFLWPYKKGLMDCKIYYCKTKYIIMSLL